MEIVNMSTQPCGCDRGAQWVCEQHRTQHVTLCGAVKSVIGGTPLVCNQPAGHQESHGISRGGGLPCHVRWT